MEQELKQKVNSCSDLSLAFEVKSLKAGMATRPSEKGKMG